MRLFLYYGSRFIVNRFGRCVRRRSRGPFEQPMDVVFAYFPLNEMLSTRILSGGAVILVTAPVAMVRRATD